MDSQTIYQALLDQNTILGEIKQDVGELKASLAPFLDNGQPGRMTKAENRLTELEAHKNKAVGYVAGAGAVGGIVAGLGAWLLSLFRH